MLSAKSKKGLWTFGEYDGLLSFVCSLLTAPPCPRDRPFLDVTGARCQADEPLKPRLIGLVTHAQSA